MAYTDRQNRIFSRIAYMDLPLYQAARDRGVRGPIPLREVLSETQLEELSK